MSGNVVLHIVGYEKCPYFNRACLFAVVCKNRKRCADYKITSLRTQKEFSNWVRRFVHTHPQTCQDTHSDESPFVFNETDGTYLGGFTELFTFMQDIDIPCDQNMGLEEKQSH